MANVSRPLIALLVGTVAFFAVWLVALKPSSPTSASSGGSVGRLQGPISAAKSVQGTVDASAAKDGGTPGTTLTPATARATTPAATTTHATATTHAIATTPATTAAKSAPATPSSATAQTAAGVRLNAVQRALKDHKVLALLFYNPAAADDQAVKRELKAIPEHHGAVVTLSVPLSELSHYTMVTDQVQVQYSPTLVLIDRHANATTIVGFADTFEIANRVDDALASP